MAQLHQAQGAGVEALAQRLEQRPVFGEGTQYALGFDHRGASPANEKAPIVLHWGLHDGRADNRPRRRGTYGGVT